MFDALSAYKNAAICVLLAFVLGFAGIQTVRLNARSLELKASIADNGALKASIDAQNVGIQAMKTAAAQAVETGSKANVVAKAVVSKAEAKAVAIEQAPVPADHLAAIQFLVDEAAK